MLDEEDKEATKRTVQELLKRENIIPQALESFNDKMDAVIKELLEKRKPWWKKLLDRI